VCDLFRSGGIMRRHATTMRPHAHSEKIFCCSLATPCTMTGYLATGSPSHRRHCRHQPTPAPPLSRSSKRAEVLQKTKTKSAIFGSYLVTFLQQNRCCEHMGSSWPGFAIRRKEQIRMYKRRTDQLEASRYEHCRAFPHWSSRDNL
jgi:hypothetical protein